MVRGCAPSGGQEGQPGGLRGECKLGHPAQVPVASGHGPGGGALQIAPLPRLGCGPHSALRLVPLCGRRLVPRFSSNRDGRGVVTGVVKRPAHPVPFFPSLCVWNFHTGPPNPGTQASRPCALTAGRAGGGLAAPGPWGFESHWPCFTWASRWPSSPPLPCPALHLHNHRRLKSGLFMVFGESGSPGEELHPHSCSQTLSACLAGSPGWKYSACNSQETGGGGGDRLGRAGRRSP